MSDRRASLSSGCGFLALAAAGLAGLPAVPAFAREPTEYEQYMVELVNRARLDPEAEVVLLGTGSLNEGPPTLGGFGYTIPAGPKQPLAVNAHRHQGAPQPVLVPALPVEAPARTGGVATEMALARLAAFDEIPDNRFGEHLVARTVPAP